MPTVHLIDHRAGFVRRLFVLGRSTGLALAVLVMVAVGFPLQNADAVLISTGDGTGNTTAPSNDPGFSNVGVVNGLSGVYVRNGWVLTANHVGEHPIVLDGVSWEPLVGSKVRILNADGTGADLIAFKLREKPGLPDLLLASSAPSLNDSVILVGNGFDRDSALTWSGIDGWNWANTKSIRWGTNDISEMTFVPELNTQAIGTSFDERRGGPPGLHEADVVNGDSGGAVFRGSGGSAELVGILFARSSFVDQPARTSLYGNHGYASDLYHYRASLLAIIDRPDCDDGLDDDLDGLADYPADPGCSSPTDTDEREPTLACDNGLDDDGDGLIDLADVGCSGPGDTSERGAPYACDNGVDDDLDSLVDYPNDPECLHPTGMSEVPEPGFALLIGIGGATASALTRRRDRHRRLSRRPSSLERTNHR
jgi:hypothetical protein